MTMTAAGPSPQRNSADRLPFLQLFLIVMRKRPVEAMAALYWHLTRRRLRARNRLLAAAAQSPLAYAAWIATVECEDLAAAVLAERTTALASRPTFSVVIWWEDAAAICQALESLRTQSYPDWELVIASATSAPATGFDDARVRFVAEPRAMSRLRAAIASARGDWIVPIPCGGILAPSALMRYAEAAASDPAPIVIYGDEDRLETSGKRLQPWFKPEWNRELFLAQDYLSATAVLDRAEANAALELDPGDGSVEDLLLALLIETDRPVAHVPAFTCHLTGARPASAVCQAERVSRYLARYGAHAEPGPFESVRVRWPAPDPAPLVTVIIPTRDQADLLQACIESVIARTTYPAFEILVVDNDSRETAALRYLDTIARSPRMRVLRWAHHYNYAAINNMAAKAAHGEYLCLLNNDTEVLGAEWLEEMMRYAARPEVGAVGAKLLYGDGSIQHAGVVVGLGGAAGHAHRYLPVGDPGYFARAHVPHYVSAVTAACLVVEKRKFDAVGGFDADELAVAFNDVDLCLKLQQRGWRNIYAAHAVLTHYESKSRGNDLSNANRARYFAELGVLQARWGTRDYADPLHHPALDRGGETYAIRL